MSLTPERTAASLLSLEAATVATLIPVALFQTGILSTLPDPPSAIFDSDRITASKSAHPLGVPDALPGILNFAATGILAYRAQRCPTARRLLALKLVGDAGFAALNMGRQVVTFRRLCSWCTGTALLAFTSAAVGRHEIRNVAEELVGKGAVSPRVTVE